MTDTIEKLYYSIGEVCQQLNVSDSAIRFWEKHFGKLHTYQYKDGTRKFTPHDVERVRYVVQLLKQEGYTLRGSVKKYFERYRPCIVRNAKQLAA